jgi:hypothetical protein
MISIVFAAYLKSDIVIITQVLKDKFTFESAEGDQFIMTNYELLEFLNALDDVGYFYLGEL